MKGAVLALLALFVIGCNEPPHCSEARQNIAEIREEIIELEKKLQKATGEERDEIEQLIGWQKEMEFLNQLTLMEPDC